MSRLLRFARNNKFREYRCEERTDETVSKALEFLRYFQNAVFAVAYSGLVPRNM
jgi:hypothetical protein